MKTTIFLVVVLFFSLQSFASLPDERNRDTSIPTVVKSKFFSHDALVPSESLTPKNFLPDAIRTKYRVDYFSDGTTKTEVVHQKRERAWYILWAYGLGVVFVMMAIIFFAYYSVFDLKREIAKRPQKKYRMFEIATIVHKKEKEMQFHFFVLALLVFAGITFVLHLPVLSILLGLIPSGILLIAITESNEGRSKRMLEPFALKIHEEYLIAKERANKEGEEF